MATCYVSFLIPVPLSSYNHSQPKVSDHEDRSTTFCSMRVSTVETIC